MRLNLTLAAALAAAALAPGMASADSLILDPGTPLTGTGAPSPDILNTAGWYAEEFTVTAGETITQLSAYLTQGVGGGNNTFTWDLYSASGTFLGATTSTRTPAVDTATGTYTADGWNSVAVNWSPTPGQYWVALQVGSTSMTHGLDLPVEAVPSTGTLPATAFAFAAGTTGKYQLDANAPVGMQVSAVPLPAAVWLLGSGLLGLGSLARRKTPTRAGYCESTS
jgi:hypothetical protein